MKLFGRNTTREYFAQLSENLKSEVNRMTDEEILTCDFQEWIDYLISKYEIQPLVLYENSTEQSIIGIKVKKHNPFYRNNSFEREFFEIDGVCLRYKIPFDGDATLFELKPNSIILTTFEVASLKVPKGENYGYIIYEMEFTKKELEEKKEGMKDYVQGQFNREFSNYRTMIDNVNREVKAYNDGLSSHTEEYLKNRKARASSLASISQMLEIPLKKNDNAPNTTPIPLKKVERVGRPTQKAAPKEYCISDKDYENINNIIYMSGSTMEKTARTYINNSEEELRDILLASLNTHYDNATGETFRKIGKTDINIEFNNKAAYIGECKIWHGEKKFDKAVQQVLNYSTWKDTKVSVIVFNKANSTFNGVIDKIEEWVKTNTKSYNNAKTNVWSCIYHRSDTNVDIKLEIMAFDLYVDESKLPQGKK